MSTRHGFELVREQAIPERGSLARIYRHVRTGAQLLSLTNDDENKVFGITFFTPPPDSTGLPHIMEHSVLCGSRKYPLKEPFVELIKGSMKTFLNAFTFSDKTCYPVASTNLQDFYNLMDVYLDAVFYPRITPAILQQEGWHYELDTPDDTLKYKGVVFNEMKGAYSSPDGLLGRETEISLFPDTIYSVDSGGDPRAIPNLTYEQFKAYHDTYYHPSNAFIYFYGDDPEDERLRRMDEYLRDFAPITLDRVVPLQPRFDRPQHLVFGYDAGADDGSSAKRGFVSVNWLLTETTDTETMIGLSVLAHILIGTSAAPLRKALIDSGLGEGLTGSGVSSQVREAYFRVGLKGIDPGDASAVESLILTTLQQLVRDGIDDDLIEASLNTIEFQVRELNTGGFPRGLALMIEALSTWLYGGDPLEPLQFERPLADLKEKIAAGNYFEGLIEQYLLQNTHRTTVLLKPDPELRARLDAEERDRLDQVRDSLSDEQIEQIVAETKALKLAQEKPDPPEALATIPGLTLDDLDREAKTIPSDLAQHDGADILYHDLFTNGIVYLDVGFDLHQLPDELLPYVALFSRALTQMGTTDEDFVRLSRRIGRTTGGVGASSLLSAIHGEPTSAAYLFLRGKSTVEQTGDLLAIMRDILLKVNLDDRDRFRQLVLESKAGFESSIIPGGHRVASRRLRSHFDEADWVSELMSGVTQLFFLRQLAEMVEQDWTTVREHLMTIRDVLVNRAQMIANVTVDADNWRTIQPQLTDFISALPTHSSSAHAWTRNIYMPEHEGLSIPAQVNYVAKGANLYELGFERHGSTAVVLNYLNTTYMWERVRVQGGAYGGFTSFDGRSGVFNYASYRDPNLLKTLDVYDNAPTFLKGLALDEKELTRSIIGAISSMDAYQLPDAKGYTALSRHLTGETDADRQQRRDEVLSTTMTDFRRFADVLEAVVEQGLVVVLGSDEALNEANAARNHWLKVTKVL